jgi:hypothetical protein
LESLFDEYNVSPAANADPPPKVELKPPEKAETAILAEVASMRQEFAADKARRTQDADEADIKQAVDTLGKEAGIKGKESLLRGYLIAKATEDQRLRALWEGRGQNPTAWNKALKILSDDVKGEFSVPDPQMEENQRAMDESQRAASTSLPVTAKPEDRVKQMNPAEFAQFWGGLAGRG